MTGLIWAQSADGVIGAQGGIPWRLSEDLKHFAAVTGGQTVVMGRRTWDSLPARFRPLPGRRNIVVTRQGDWSADGAERASSLADAVALAATGDVRDEVWVVGGGELYREAIRQPDATRLEVTEVDVEVAGDTHAPAIDASWTIDDRGAWQTSADGIRFRFLRYRRAG